MEPTRCIGPRAHSPGPGRELKHDTGEFMQMNETGCSTTNERPLAQYYLSNNFAMNGPRSSKTNNALPVFLQKKIIIMGLLFLV